MKELINKNALVTGAANGIGKHLVGVLRQQGATVIACDINKEALITNFGKDDGCTIHKLDVSDIKEWEALFSSLDNIDYLFNVAGVIRPGYIDEIDVNSIDLQIDVNLKGTMYGTQLAVKKMKAAGSGHIINFASMAALAPVEGISAYVATKFGVRGFSLAIANEVRDKNIHVSVVCPDATDTQMLDDQMNSESAAITFSAPKILTVEEICDAVLEDVIKDKKPEIWVPYARGVQAYIGGTFPRLAIWMTKFFRKQGLKNQSKFRKNRK